MMERIPFKQLSPFYVQCSGEFSKVFGTENPNILVKETRSVTNGRSPYGRKERYSLNEFKRAVVEPALRLMDTRYDLARFIPPFGFVWGLNEDGEERGFIVMKKVREIPMDDAAIVDNLIPKQMDELLAACVTMECKTNCVITPDVLGITLLKNIIYGTIDGNVNPQPYLIDIHPAAMLAHRKLDWESRIYNARRRFGYEFPLTLDALKSFPPIGAEVLG